MGFDTFERLVQLFNRYNGFIKRSYVLVFFSIAFLVLANVYYYIDTYNWQVNTQKSILQKQSLIAGDQLSQYFKKTQTNILLLLSPDELNSLFYEGDRSIYVQKRLELLFSRYSEHLIQLKVYDTDGHFFGLRKTQNQSLISSFGSEKPLDIFKSKVLIDEANNSIVYQQPVFDGFTVYGYVEFNMSLNDFFHSIFNNFNVQDFYFQWILDADGNVLYNTIGQKIFEPHLAPLNKTEKKQRHYSEVHTIVIGNKKMRAVSVFSRLNMEGSDYTVVFSFPVATITSSLLRNFFTVAVITLIVIIFILFIFGKYIKKYRKEGDRLKQSEQALKTIIHYLPVGVLLLDPNRCIRQVNDSAKRLFKLNSDEQVLGQVAADTLLFGQRFNIQKSTFSSTSKKYVISNRDKEEQVVLLEEIPFFLFHEKYWLQVYVEVTLLDQERKSELAANRAKSTFIANMSHELRTPLNSIIGLTEVLTYSPMQTEDRDLLAVVKRSADMLLALINDILDFSKIEAGHMEIESIPFDLAKEIDDTINGFRPSANKKNICLNWRTTTLLPLNYKGDLIRTRQVLNNLISNAIKFTEQGEILLEVTAIRRLNGSPGLQFSVKDTGIGIAPEKIKSIFNPFSQGDESTTRKYGGTGLGITISKQLITMLGGEIWAVSPSGLSRNPQYPGAEFIFTLPLGQTSHHKEFNFSHITSVDQIKALVVTDAELQVSQLTKSLSSLGVQYNVLAPSSETLEVLQTNISYHILIIDHRPDFDGMTFMQEVYNRQLQSTLPIIMQSSDFVESNTSLAKRLGVDLYLRKPIKLFILEDSILRFFPNINHKSVRESDKVSTRLLKIVVAEDRVLDQRIVESLFRQLGLAIKVVSNGQEAVDICCEQPVDIVFMDLHMPILDGFDATEQLRQKDIQCPVIAISSLLDKQVTNRALEVGMNDFISKPIDIEDLSRMLTKWCKHESRWY